MKLLPLLCLFLVVSAKASASCQIEIEDEIIGFETSEHKGTSIEILTITLPKTIDSWPLTEILFEYFYDKHYVRGSLGYKLKDNIYVSELKYSKEFARSVKVSVSYSDPQGECQTYKQYGFKNA